jgi:hypothetical protein
MEKTHPSYRVAIFTKYLGPTNSRGARIKAYRADAGTGQVGAASMTVSYDYALDSYDNHAAAVEALVAKLGWDDTEWVLGGTDNGCYVAVSLPRNLRKDA